MPKCEQWDLALATMREKYPLSELKPENWNDYYFYDGLNWLDLYAESLEHREAEQTRERLL